MKRDEPMSYDLIIRFVDNNDFFKGLLLFLIIRFVDNNDFFKGYI